MKIFNLEIFGSDADYWLQQPTMWQVEWIKSNTNQQNDDLIDEFLSAVTKEDEKQCLNCGQNGNFSKGISEQVIESVESIDVTSNGNGNSNERPIKAKSRKGK